MPDVTDAISPLAGLAPHEQEALRLRLRGAVGRRAAPAAVERRPPGVRRIPLSPVQLQMWMMESTAASRGSYALPVVAIRPGGHLRVAVARRVLGRLLDSHPVLRVRIEVDEAGHPWQVVDPEGGPGCDLIDASALDGALADSLALAVGRRMTARPFDLRSGPLLRLAVLRRRHGDMILLAAHHLIADGHTIDLLAQEFARGYRAIADGLPWRPDPPSVDFLDWAWSMAGRQDAPSQRATAAEPWSLPIDRIGATRRTAATAIRILPDDTCRAVRGGAARAQTTLHSFGLASLAVACSRSTGRSRFALAIPVTLRGRGGSGSMLGPLSRLAAIAVDCSRDPSLGELLAQARDQVLTAMEATATLPGDPGAWFPAVFAFQPERQVAGASASLRYGSANVAKFDLFLTLGAASDGSVSLRVEYDAGRYLRASIDRLLDLWARALVELAERPWLRASEAELADLAATAAAVVTPAAPPAARRMYPRFEERAEAAPDAAAVVSGESVVTYGCLQRRAERVASALIGHGARAGSVIGVAMERSACAVATLLGILRSGCCYLAVDPGPRTAWASDALARAGVELLLEGNAKHPTRLPGSGMDGAPRDAAGLACVIPTSGSTGVPKLVAVEQDSIVGLVDGGYAVLDDRQRVLHHSPMTFDAASFEIWGPLLSGGACVLAPRGPTDLAQLAVTIARQQVSTAWLTSSLFNASVDDRPDLLSPLEQALVGGEQVSVPHARRALAAHPRLRLINGYGPTETTTFACCGDIARDLHADAARVPVGLPIDGVDVRIVDARWRPVPPGCVGELCITGAGVARGYHREPGPTAERFVPDPFSGRPGARMYLSGDLARRLPGGAIEVIGRRDRQVKINGHRVEPDETAAALARDPIVSDAVVLVAGEAPRLSLCAYVVLRADEDPSAVAGRLRRTLPPHAVPAALIPVPSIPRTPAGKIDRSALPSIARRRPAEPPRDDVERALVEIWQEVLGGPPVGIDFGFVEAGGDSMAAIRVAARAAGRGLHLPADAVLAQGTIAECARYVSRSEAAPPAGALVEAVEVGLTPMQRWLFDRGLSDISRYAAARSWQLCHPLHRPALASAIAVLMERHEALRLRFSLLPPHRQRIAPADPRGSLVEIDLTGVPAALRDAIAMEALSAVRRSLDIANGPVLRVALVIGGCGAPPTLAVVVHHLVVDEVSMAVLAEEFAVAYGDAFDRRALSLPAPGSGFLSWARRLRRFPEQPGFLPSRRHWAAQPWSGVREVPRDHDTGPNDYAGSDDIAVSLSLGDAQALAETTRGTGLQVVDLLLAALASTYGEWTGASSLFLDLTDHGRFHPFPVADFSRTVGFVSCLCPLFVPTDGVGLAHARTVRRLLDEQAPHRIAYGLLRQGVDGVGDAAFAQHPDPEIKFNVHGVESSPFTVDGGFGPSPLRIPGVLAPADRRRYLINIEASIGRGHLSIEAKFSRNAHRRETVRNWLETTCARLGALAAQGRQA